MLASAQGEMCSSVRMRAVTWDHASPQSACGRQELQQGRQSSAYRHSRPCDSMRQDTKILTCIQGHIVNEMTWQVRADALVYQARFWCSCIDCGALITSPYILHLYSAPMSCCRSGRPAACESWCISLDCCNYLSC